MAKHTILDLGGRKWKCRRMKRPGLYLSTSLMLMPSTRGGPRLWPLVDWWVVVSLVEAAPVLSLLGKRKGAKSRAEKRSEVRI